VYQAKDGRQGLGEINDIEINIDGFHGNDADGVLSLSHGVGFHQGTLEWIERPWISDAIVAVTVDESNMLCSGRSGTTVVESLVKGRKSDGSRTSMPLELERGSTTLAALVAVH
jgi:hypothetical protein